VFAVPTYAFIAAIAALVVAGLVHAAGHGFYPFPVRHLALVQAVTVLLVLRAFASGSTAMTGIEAISNAVPVEWRNAQITLSRMIGLLIGMFGGVLVIIQLEGAAFLVEVAQYRCASSGRYRGFPGEGEFRSGPGPLLVACTYSPPALRPGRVAWEAQAR
jgi:amino acid transporter